MLAFLLAAKEGATEDFMAEVLFDSVTLDEDPELLGLSCPESLSSLG